MRPPCRIASLSFNEPKGRACVPLVHPECSGACPSKPCQASCAPGHVAGARPACARQLLALTPFSPSPLTAQLGTSCRRARPWHAAACMRHAPSLAPHMARTQGDVRRHHLPSLQQLGHDPALRGGAAAKSHTTGREEVVVSGLCLPIILLSLTNQPRPTDIHGRPGRAPGARGGAWGRAPSPGDLMGPCPGGAARQRRPTEFACAGHLP